MKYFKIDYPTYVLPKEKYFLTDDICIFNSKKSSDKKSVSPENTFASLLIFGDSSLIDNRFIHNRIKQFIVFLNFIINDGSSAKWLLGFSFLDIRIEETKSFEILIEENEQNEKIKPMDIYYDFNKFPLPYHLRYGSEVYIDFIGLFKKYIDLKPEDSLKHKIELCSFSWTIKSVISSFYDNDNLDISLTYILVDSIIDEYIENKIIIKRCEKCGFEKKSKKNDRIRIKEFSEALSKKEANILNQIIWNIYTIRNEFIHEGKKPFKDEISSEWFKKAKEETGKEMLNLYDEAKYNRSRGIGLLNLKIIIKELLIERLSSV